MDLEVKLAKKFPGFDLQVEFRAGLGITVLFGRSGCGKTTTLRLIAGLTLPDSGRIMLGKEVFYDSQTALCLPPQARKTGYVGQNHALFPHLTVAENIAFGAPKLKCPAALTAANEIMRQFHLEELKSRCPAQISGGQQQRAALARALIGNPALLLLDEPFSAIDGPGRVKMRECLIKVIKHQNLPAVLVTHDLFEALTLADRLIIMDNGRITAEGTPQEIINRRAEPVIGELLAPATELQAFFAAWQDVGKIGVSE